MPTIEDEAGLFVQFVQSGPLDQTRGRGRDAGIRRTQLDGWRMVDGGWRVIDGGWSGTDDSLTQPWRSVEAVLHEIEKDCGRP